MNYTQTITTGIDSLIQTAQTRLYDFVLTGLWEVSDTNVLNFGRVYRNPSGDNDGYIPEAYVDGQYISSSATSSRGGLFQQAGKVVCFWATIDTEKRQKNADYKSVCEFICLADMSVIKPNGITSNTQRLDEVMANNLEEFFLCNGCGWVVSDISRDINEVLKSFSGAAKKSALTRNMSGTGNTNFCSIKLTVENYNNLFN